MRMLIAAVTIGLLPSVAEPQTRELGISLDGPVKNLAVRGHLRAPADRRPARCVFVLINGPLNRGVFESPAWRESADALDCAMLLATFEGPGDRGLPPEEQPARNAAAGGADALAALLDRFAARARRPELRTVPLLFWGFSASGSFGTTFAAIHPGRTIGVVRFQSHTREVAVDHHRIRDVPHLLVAGGEDQIAGTDDARRLWTIGRKAGTPWTLAVQPGMQHGEGVAAAMDFMLSWTAAVVRLRTGGATGLAAVDPAATWHGDHRTRGTAPGRPGPSDELETSWLPDERTARLWRAVIGARPE